LQLYKHNMSVLGKNWKIINKSKETVIDKVLENRGLSDVDDLARFLKPDFENIEVGTGVPKFQIITFKLHLWWNDQPFVLLFYHGKPGQLGPVSLLYL